MNNQVPLGDIEVAELRRQRALQQQQQQQTQANRVQREIEERLLREEQEQNIARRLEREAEEEAEERRRLLEQGGDQEQQQPDHDNPLHGQQGDGNEAINHDAAVDGAANNHNINAILETAKRNRFWNYCTTSLILASAMIYYALRTRQAQWYLALVYLSSSKWALLIIGNAFVALAVKLFDVMVQGLLNGLRLQEAEGLQDFFRWNLPETCLALTMFRSELDGRTAIKFLCLVWIKSMHHVTMLRENHTRLTQETVVSNDPNDNDELDGNLFGTGTDSTPAVRKWWHIGPMRVPWVHFKLFILLVLLQCFDCVLVHAMTLSIIQHGPSVNMLFLFEATILLVSAWSHIMLWLLHAMDGALHVLGAKPGITKRFILPHWKDYKATFTFAVELQAQAVQFLFYVSFFGIVLTYYGPPINLLREVYVSFAAFKERLTSFMKYRRLMASMDRFANVTDEKLEEAGRVCIICRDEMTVADCKQLPVCNHLFHKSCLREWLVQQQSCPTCRSDITAMEAQERTRRAAEMAAAIRAIQGFMPELENNDDNNEAIEIANEDEIRAAGDHEQVAQNDEPPRASSIDRTGPQHDTATAKPRTSPSLPFPALYRASVPSTGAVVYSDAYGIDVKVFKRRIPYGTIVLCLGDTERQGVQVLKVPDGWIYPTCVQRLYAVAVDDE
ncbi:hypothetical protein MPSEU_000108600 [Mayamaea pseudoterrestris]|nr:hypothetical protein MPSEU_000108600 [Mayamaea pseudoterrestris]